MTGCDDELVAVASICTLMVNPIKAASASICARSRYEPDRDETKATLSAWARTTPPNTTARLAGFLKIAGRTFLAATVTGFWQSQAGPPGRGPP
jgi:hypothetical protein